MTENNSGKGTLIALIGVVVALVGSIATYFVYTQQLPQYDKETGCLLVKGKPTPDHHLVFLLDLTDPLTQQQANAARVSLENYINEAPTNTLIELYALKADKSSFAEPLILQCKRRDGSDANALSENARKLKRQFEQKFFNPLVTQIEQAIGNKDESNYSPIIEAIQSIGYTGFGKHPVAGTKTLVIYSDMIQHMPAFSMFTTRLNYDGYKKLDYAQQHMADLPGVEVELNYFYNRPKFQKGRNVQFWQYLFHDAGATVTKTFNLGQ